MARTFERSRLRLGLVIAVICGAIAFLGVKALDGATIFFRTADEVAAQRAELGSRTIRLLGIVVPGSIEARGADVGFVVEYACVRIPVHHEGSRPPLFKGDQPVMLEGAFASARSETFESDKIIVRHTEEYRTDESQQAEATERERCDR
jgi:cytochrome c-type biogenesis protein CcmE